MDTINTNFDEDDATYLGVNFKELETLKNPHLPDEEIDKLIPPPADDGKKKVLQPVISDEENDENALSEKEPETKEQKIHRLNEIAETLKMATDKLKID